MSTISTATQYSITFGLFKRDGEPVSEDQFYQFLNSEVTPLFSGYSLREELGMYKGEPEPCYVITIISSDYDDALAVYGIAKAYKQQFDQETVLINSTSCFPELV